MKLDAGKFVFNSLIYNGFVFLVSTDQKSANFLPAINSPVVPCSILNPRILFECDTFNLS